ncbi:sensor domain-containing protein [Haloferax sp. S1W]|uniref:sensor domain-containing protein n=1 Tax=Haloferax sp. S1W TaxID=3377110 RepID=UPI0037CAC24E
MTQTESRALDVSTVVSQAVGAPFHAQTYKNFLYLLAAFPLGILYFVTLISTGAIGGASILLLFGAPLLVATLLLGTVFMRIETESARRLLGFELTHRTGEATLDDGIVPYVKDLATDYGTYVSLVVACAKFWVGVGLFAALTTWVTLVASFILLPLYYDMPGVTFGITADNVQVLPEIRFTQDLWTFTIAEPVHLVTGEVTSFQGALLVSVVGVVLLFVGLNLVNASAWLLGYATKQVAPHARVFSRE